MAKILIRKQLEWKIDSFQALLRGFRETLGRIRRI